MYLFSLPLAATNHRIPKAERERLASMTVSAVAESSGASTSPVSTTERGVADALNASASISAFSNDLVFEDASMSGRQQRRSHPFDGLHGPPPLTPIHAPRVPLMPSLQLPILVPQQLGQSSSESEQPPYGFPSTFAVPALQTAQFAASSALSEPYDIKPMLPSFQAATFSNANANAMAMPPAWALGDAPADSLPPSRGSSQSSSNSAAVLTPLFVQAQSQQQRQAMLITQDPKPLSPFRAGDSDSLYHRVSIYEAQANTPYDSVVVLESSTATFERRAYGAPLTSSISAAVALLPDDEFELVAHMCDVGARLIVGPYSASEAASCPPEPRTLLDLFAYTGECTLLVVSTA